MNFQKGNANRDFPIEVSGINHFFGTGEARKQVLHDNHLRVAAGEIVMMKGQSGSGKTTLLTLIGTLRSVQEGQLNLLGHPLHDLTQVDLHQLRKRLGFIFQAHNLFSSLTALQNVRMALELQPNPLPRPEQNRLCEEMLVAVGLGERIHYKPKALSGGQKQRVAVARGLVHRPEILLADEPTAALDAEAGKQVMQLFQREAQERGTAIVVVTHDDRIVEVADRIVKMNYGRIERDTVVKEAEFLGEMLHRCEVFSGVAASTLTQLTDNMARQEHAPGTRIVRMGDAGDKFYLIRDGEVVVRRPVVSDESQLTDVAVLARGQYFGEMALLTGEPRNAHVDAVTPVVTYSLDAATFKGVMNQRKSIKQEVVSTLLNQ